MAGLRRQYASTVPYQGDALSFPGVELLRHPTADAIVMTVWISQGQTAPTQAPALTPPYRLSKARVLHEYAAQPSPNVPLYQITTDVQHQYDVSIFVWFGRRQPSARVLRRAQAMLDRLTLPTWSGENP